jgi:catechol 2,3-dioxygenase-like lactoylglutathione lyase family enzyme
MPEQFSIREAVMSTTTAASSDTTTGTRAGGVDLKLEVALIPVSDVDRAAEFYKRLGWRVDYDGKTENGRALQVTPPGSPSSIIFGTGLDTPAKPGLGSSLVLAVDDVDAARKDLIARGAKVSEVFNYAGGPFNKAVANPRVGGRDPQGRSYFSFASFKDPDGNEWLLQEITTRLPGRVAGDTTYASVSDLAQALRRAEAAHGKHEAQMGKRDEDWPSWYAEYMVREQSGGELPH